ncbi:Glycyl-tRNA synthetase beta chain [plant metagenome]|uniref:glycine--tRNA ligase n=1 Tax=plant metagenome TaxID=1297885 RepID=A0A484PQS3_9ZZZZ
MSAQDIRPLLIELFTEELPPKALRKLGQAFADGLRASLAANGLLAENCDVTPYATPRRLAALFSQVRAQAPEQTYAEKLMPAQIGLAADGTATPALVKKLAAKGLADIDLATLARESDGKQDYLVARGTAPGIALAEGLQQALDASLAALPIPKVMRYQLDDGHTTVRFVRPAHGLVALHDTDIVPVTALGLTAGRTLRGHRFLSKHAFDLAAAGDYAQLLAEEGHVIAAFDTRRATIEAQLQTQAARLGGSLGTDPEVESLLDEVTALVEWPTVYAGEFEERFLAVPQECLILTMRLNQKYFPLFDPASGKLTHRFLIVSNMSTKDPHNIIEGNQRVVRPRLADAEFFFQTDRKTPLASRNAQLGSIVYHNKLGSQLERVERVRALARFAATTLGGDARQADRAAELAKADLSTLMVGEFPELQGVIGAYYATGDGESPEVVRALREQYRIRLDAPVDRDGLTAAVLFLAERAETLVGIWSIGQAPTGERDPFGLRRAAQGIISAFEQLAAGGWLKAAENGPLTLSDLLAQAAAGFGEGRVAPAVLTEVRDFIYERVRNQLAGEFDRSAVDAVIALQPPLHQVAARVRAVVSFLALPEAASLAAANKRIGNLLKKAEGEPGDPDASRYVEAAERSLAEAVDTLQPQADACLAAGDFGAALSTLAQARGAVDAFFADVMVMADDPDVRANRLALLARLHRLMNQVADISRLAQ